MADNSDPTAAYRKQQGMAPVSQSYDPTVVGWITQAARATGADPAALLATSIQESGARRGAVGDAGTSFGPFQFHRGGALGTHSPQWANSYAAVLNRAQEFRRLGVHGGPGAAAVQRPADRSLYAQGVASHLDQARAILAGMGKAPATDTPGRAPATPAGPDRHADPTGDAILSQLAGSQPGGTGASSGLQNLLNANARLVGIEAPTFVAPPPLAQSTRTTPGTVTPPKLKVTGKGAGSPEGIAAVNLAKQYMGVKYQWGGESPKGFDCSGLLQYVWGKRGVQIPRTTYQQIKAGRPVSLMQIQPGDAVFFGTAKDPHHVGMAIGNGKFIEAPHTGATVRISNLAGRKDIVAARRFA